MNNSLEENKRVAAHYFECQRSGNLLSALDLFSKDVTWTIPGEWEMAGTLKYDDVRRMMEGLNLFDGGLEFEHHSITAEDDRVVIFEPDHDVTATAEPSYRGALGVARGRWATVINADVDVDAAAQ